MDSSNQHYNEALALAHAGKLDEAIVQLQAAISLAGNQPNYYNLLGTCYAQKGLYSEAIGTWKRTLSLDSELERAYQSIEKARHLEGEVVVESRKRPLALAVAGLVVACAFLLAGGAGLAYKAWAMSGSIQSLNEQVALRDAEIDKLEEGLQGTIPLADYKELEEKRQNLQGQLAEKDETIRRHQREYAQLQQSHARENAQMQQSLALRNEELAQFNTELMRIPELKGQVASLEGERLALEDRIKEKDTTITSLNTSRALLQEQVHTLNTQLGQSQQQLTQQRVALIDEKNEAVQIKSSDIDTLTQRITAQEAELTKIDTATKVMQQALLAFDEHRFDDARGFVGEALKLDPDHVIAVDLRAKVEKVLEDPFQRELLVQGAKMLEENNAQRRQELIDDLAQRGLVTMKNGDYAQAASYFRRLLALEPSSEKQRSKAVTDLRSCEESAQRLALQLDELRREAASGNTDRAKEILRLVLKESPGNEEAIRLRDGLQ